MIDSAPGVKAVAKPHLVSLSAKSVFNRPSFDDACTDYTGLFRPTAAFGSASFGSPFADI